MYYNTFLYAIITITTHELVSCYAFLRSAHESMRLSYCVVVVVVVVTFATPL